MVALVAFDPIQYQHGNTLNYPNDFCRTLIVRSGDKDGTKYKRSSALSASQKGNGSLNLRVLAVDHGEKRIGLALSDLTGTIANPLTVLEHVSRAIDAAQVATIAAENGARLIVIGQSFDEGGQPNLAGRRAARFAEALHGQTDIPVQMWDESFSTQQARAARIQMNVSRKKRAGHLDQIAATIILQSYLDAHPHDA